MKRFAWPLQRYLDVVRRREDALVAEAYAAGARVAEAAQAVRIRREALTAMLEKVARESGDRRLGDQQTVMSCAGAERRAMDVLEAELARRKAVREEVLVRLRDVRARRQMLEKLRAEARGEYLRQADAEEQVQNDQTAQIAFVRASAERTADSRSISA